MQGLYSMRSPAVKRLMKEAQELREPTEQYFTQPLEDNLFEWHFTLRGPNDTEFDGGLYHGRIILPPDYPMKPPSIIILTPNGRFETNTKICLSISGHHPESWQPSWSIRTAMLAIIGFMPTHGGGALGSLDYTPDERKILAKRSRNWSCPHCGKIDDVLKPVTEASESTRQEAREVAAQMDFKNEKERQDALKAVESSKGQTTPQTTQQTSSAEPSSSTSTPVSSPNPVPPMFLPPYSQFPFMPPFPSPGQQPRPTSGAATVPRFPLPFVSPMFPPMPPYMMQNSAFPMPPFGPGMPVPPWPPGNSNMGTRPPVVPPTGESVTTGERTPPVSSVENTSTASVTTTVDPTTNTTVNSGAAEETDSTESVAGTSQTTEVSDLPAGQNTDTGSGVRQRNVNRDPVQSPLTQPRITRVNHRAEIQDQPSRPSVGYLVFVGTILTIIALLIFRRLHMMKYFTFGF